jgi:hypothetical protein
MQDEIEQVVQQLHADRFFQSRGSGAS